MLKLKGFQGSRIQVVKFRSLEPQYPRILESSNPFCQLNGRRTYFKNCDNCPVEQVSWNDIQKFINRLNSKTGGNKYRLPTEAEWEYAARSGGKTEKYSGGDNVDSVAWYNENSGGKTHVVGQKKPNGLGIYDMSGNVWEWVQDYYGSGYYKESPRNNPTVPHTGPYRVLRGGGWFNNANYARAANRSWHNPDSQVSYLGFRLALPAK